MTSNSARPNLGMFARPVLGWLLAGAAFAAMPVAPAAAQPGPRTIALGASVSGNLRETSPEVDSRHFDSYRLRLREGDSVQVDMTSAALDSYLDVLAPGQTEEVLKSHDDIGGGSRDARLRFTAPATGDYVIRAQGYQGGTGAYTLKVQRRTVDAPPQLVAMTPGTDVSGSFTDRTAPDDDDHPYALYSFEGRKGERVRIDMVSTGLDPSIDLSLDGASGGSGFSASNDDGGEGLNARIFTILPQSGRYRIKARSINAASGSYTLRVQKYAPAGPPAPPQQLRRESPTLGRLDFDDSDLQMAVDESGGAAFFYRLYALPMTAGETVTIDLKAEDFDPVLDAGIDSALGFAVARSNDDSQGTNSRLVLTPTASGTIVIRARSLNSDSMGDYTLTVTQGPPPPSASPPAE